MLHQKILRNLKSKLNSSIDNVITIGDIFIKVAPQFQNYSTYILNYKTAMQIVEDYNKKEAYSNFLKKHNFNKKTLESLLIQPVQRLPKYVLLLEELVKVTPVEHKDYQMLIAAISSIRNMVDQINEKKKRY